jgi:hypothetical protein
MKLSFLGQSYETTLTAVEATEAPETVLFLGQPYAKKQFRVASRQMTGQELIYRGVRYSR